MSLMAMVSYYSWHSHSKVCHLFRTFREIYQPPKGARSHFNNHCFKRCKTVLCIFLLCYFFFISYSTTPVKLAINDRWVTLKCSEEFLFYLVRWHWIRKDFDFDFSVATECFAASLLFNYIYHKVRWTQLIFWTIIFGLSWVNHYVRKIVLLKKLQKSNFFAKNLFNKAKW